MSPKRVARILVRLRPLLARIEADTATDLEKLEASRLLVQLRPYQAQLEGPFWTDELFDGAAQTVADAIAEVH